jgi:hypothetical protein
MRFVLVWFFARQSPQKSLLRKPAAQRGLANQHTKCNGTRADDVSCAVLYH